MKNKENIRMGTPLLKNIKSIRRNWVAWVLILPCLLCMYFFMWRPTVTGMYYSFFNLVGFEAKEFVGFDNYETILSNTMFVKTLINTLKYTGYYIIFGFIPPIIVAIMLSEVRVWKKSLKFSVYFPAIVPTIASIMLWKLMYKPDTSGLLNGILGVFGIDPQLWLNSPEMAIPCIVISTAWNGLGANMLYYFAALQGINSELYEAATIDGAGIFKRIWHVTFPQISGVMILMFVRAVIIVFQVMEAPLVMTDGGPNGASLTLGLQAYRYAFENYQVSYSLALGVVEFLMLIGLTLLYFKIQKRIETE